MYIYIYTHTYIHVRLGAARHGGVHHEAHAGQLQPSFYYYYYYSYCCYYYYYHHYYYYYSPNLANPPRLPSQLCSACYTPRIIISFVLSPWQPASDCQVCSLTGTLRSRSNWLSFYARPLPRPHYRCC